MKDQNLIQSEEDKAEWLELEKHWDAHADDFMTEVKRGRTGYNEGFKNGLLTVNKYIHGTHRGRYYLIGADSGVGKTTLADYAFVISLWEHCKQLGKPIKIFYFSFEISAIEKKAKWVVHWIYKLYRIDLSVDYIMGRIANSPVSDEHYRMIQKGYEKVKEMLADIEMIDHLMHPTGMLYKLLNYYEQHGEIKRDVVSAEDAAKGKKGMIKGYITRNPDQVVVSVVDHLALINTEAGLHKTKEVMDRWSMYSVQLRNIFRTIVINIQQFSTNMQDAQRQKKTDVQLTPQRLDFGDSTYTYRDADAVFGMVKPMNASVKNYYGYELSVMGDFFIALYLMKNRYGPADRMLPLFINPRVGLFWDVPEPSQCSGFIQEAQRLNSLVI